MAVQVRRVYEDLQLDDGVRVLVDRVWPRGLRKDALEQYEWAKDVAPSTELRKWFGHDPDRFAEFRRRYRVELADNDALNHLRDLATRGTLTLLTATKDLDHSHATVLADLVELGESV